MSSEEPANSLDDFLNPPIILQETQEARPYNMYVCSYIAS